MSQALFPIFRKLDIEALLDTPPAAPPPHCCAAMTDALVNACDQHAGDDYACPDMVMHYSAVFDEYGLIVHDGGPSYLLIRHCPWCGVRLREPKRERWFDELEARGIADPLDDAARIPRAYLSAEWWSGAGG